MKTFKFLPVLAIVFASASAFTVSSQKDPTLYYTLDGNTFAEITGEGVCVPGDFNCQYEAIVSNPRLDHPEDFQAVGEELKIWQPETR